MNASKNILAGAVLLLLGVCFAASPVHAIDLGQLLGHGSNDPTLETFKLIHVADLKVMMTDSRDPVHIYDANGGSTREEYGIIPGATLLDSDDHYSLSVLPQNKDANLVFYCTNTLCTASHEAARRAIKAGYQNVSVMADGIKGWKQAGQPTTADTTTEGRPAS